MGTSGGMDMMVTRIEAELLWIDPSLQSNIDVTTGIRVQFVIGFRNRIFLNRKFLFASPIFWPSTTLDNELPRWQ